MLRSTTMILLNLLAGSLLVSASFSNGNFNGYVDQGPPGIADNTTPHPEINLHASLFMLYQQQKYLMMKVHELSMLHQHLLHLSSPEALEHQATIMQNIYSNNQQLYVVNSQIHFTTIQLQQQLAPPVNGQQTNFAELFGSFLAENDDTAVETIEKPVAQDPIEKAEAPVEEPKPVAKKAPAKKGSKFADGPALTPAQLKELKAKNISVSSSSPIAPRQGSGKKKILKTFVPLQPVAAKTKEYKPISEAISAKPSIPELDHIIQYLDPQDYARVARGIDPRDIAFASVLIGNRAFYNLLLPLAPRIGLSKELSANIDQFEAGVLKMSKDEPAKLTSQVDHVYPGATVDNLLAAIDAFKRRLRFAHPRQFTSGGVIDYHTGKSFATEPAKTRHIEVLNKTQPYSTDITVSKKILSLLNTKKTKGKGKPYTPAGFPKNRPDYPLAKPGTINVALAIMYLLDFFPFEDLDKVRKMVAHDQGNDETYLFTLEYVYGDHPGYEFFKKLEYRVVPAKQA